MRMEEAGRMLSVRVHPRGRVEVDRLAALTGVTRSELLRRALTLGVREIRRQVDAEREEVDLFGGEWPGTDLLGLGS